MERAEQWRCPGYQRHDMRAVLTKHAPGYDRIRTICGQELQRAVTRGQLGERPGVSSDRDDGRAGVQERFGDASAQAPAGSHDDGYRVDKLAHVRCSPDKETPGADTNGLGQQSASFE